MKWKLQSTDVILHEFTQNTLTEYVTNEDLRQMVTQRTMVIRKIQLKYLEHMTIWHTHYILKEVGVEGNIL